MCGRVGAFRVLYCKHFIAVTQVQSSESSDIATLKVVGGADSLTRPLASATALLQTSRLLKDIRSSDSTRNLLTGACGATVGGRRWSAAATSTRFPVPIAS